MRQTKRPMRSVKLLLIPAALLWLAGCASFNSGDILVDRETARAMMTDNSLTPFSEVQVYWRNFPYRPPNDSIGEGSVSNPRIVKPVPVPTEQIADFARRAREVFTEAGLYDKKKGRGTLRLELTTLGRWTYGDLWRSYLVETGFIFIIPSSLRVNYDLAADFATSTGTVRVEEIGRNKTTFHLLMAPLYPFFAPGPRENGLLKQLLWRAATDVYDRLKTAGQAPDAKLPEPEEVIINQGLSGPPLQPDRTWLPGEIRASAPDMPAIKPVEPDKTWITPVKNSPAGNDTEIKPAAADRQWEVGSAPAKPAAALTAPATPAPAPASGQETKPAAKDREPAIKDAPPADETPDD